MCLLYGVLYNMNLPKKKLISEMLENWFVADHILFGGIPQAYLTEGDVYKKYLQLKKNYFETLFEMYQLVGYTSKYMNCPKNSNEIEFSALKSVREARKLSANTLLIESSHFTKLLSESKGDVDSNIRKVSLSCQFESAFLTKQLSAAKNPNGVNDTKFVLLKNCLTECKKELINLSLTYMK